MACSDKDLQDWPSFAQIPATQAATQQIVRLTNGGSLCTTNTPRQSTPAARTGDATRTRDAATFGASREVVYDRRSPQLGAHDLASWDGTSSFPYRGGFQIRHTRCASETVKLKQELFIIALTSQPQQYENFTSC